MNMNVVDINAMIEADAADAFMQCCTSSKWVAKMVAARPHTDLDALLAAANANWAGLSESDYLEAFDGHPQIGDVSSLMAKYATTKALAAGEQSGMTEADEQTIKQLARGNSDYLEKFGFIFIICATGKSAGEMSALLQARLGNDRQSELNNAAEQQRKIFNIRLNKFSQEPKMSQITTHVLDTTRGRPACALPITLFNQVAGRWQQMAVGLTNSDGRIADLLASDLVLPAGNYRIHFDTKVYFESQHQQGFYPYVDIVFEIDAAGSHYHIPLLLTAYGYSTYRGS